MSSSKKLTNEQFKELETEYIPSLTEQIYDRQSIIFSDLDEIKEYNRKLKDFKHKTEKDSKTLLVFLKDVLCPRVDKLTELIGKKRWIKT